MITANTTVAGQRLRQSKRTLLENPLSLEDQEMIKILLLEMLEDQSVLDRSWTFDYGGEPDTGFIIRCGDPNEADGTLYDRKVFFHFRPQLWRLLNDRGIKLTRRQVLFLTLAEKHYNAYLAIMLEVAKAFGEDVYESARQTDDHCLRLLAYTELRDPKSPLVAQPHNDRGFATLAINSWFAEVPSLLAVDKGATLPHDGLEFLDPETNNFKPAHRPANYMVVFPGGKAEEHYGVKAHPHQVRGSGTDRLTVMVIRVAEVFFFHILAEHTLDTKDVM